MCCLLPSSSQLLSCTQNPPASSSAVARTVGMCHYSYFIFLKTLLTTTLISALGAAFLPCPSHLKMDCTCLLVRSSSQLLSCLQVVLNRPETPTNESLSNLAVPYTLNQHYLKGIYTAAKLIGAGTATVGVASSGLGLGLFGDLITD